jgi:hypothetical protein
VVHQLDRAAARRIAGPRAGPAGRVRPGDVAADEPFDRHTAAAVRAGLAALADWLDLDLDLGSGSGSAAG